MQTPTPKLEISEFLVDVEPFVDNLAEEMEYEGDDVGVCRSILLAAQAPSAFKLGLLLAPSPTQVQSQLLFQVRLSKIPISHPAFF